MSYLLFMDESGHDLRQSPQERTQLAQQCLEHGDNVTKRELTAKLKLPLSNDY